MESVLVTGGCGFIGSEFIRQWMAHESSHLVNLDKLTYAGNLHSLEEIEANPRYTFVHGDIADERCLKEIFQEHQPAAIINFAAESHVDRSIDGPEEFVRTNVLGTCRLLEEAKKYWSSLPEGAGAKFRFIHISTDEVYGSLGTEGFFTESTAYKPNSPYSASKAASDHFVRAYHQTYGFPSITTNCSNNYGPFQYPEKLIPLTILNCLEGKPLPVYGDGRQVRDWLHVSDHCRAIRAVLYKGQLGEVYNVGGGSELENITVVNHICEAVDELAAPNHRPCSKLIKYVTDRPGHDRRYAISYEKISAELGWQPNISFAEGIKSTVQWYLTRKDWVDGIRTGGYRSHRLGLDKKQRHETAPMS